MLVDVKPDMSVVREEIFGPVVVAQRFDDLDEVARQANDTRFGLAAGIWTNNCRAMHKLAAKLKAGTVWGNCHAMIDPALPFGGYKESGLGREQGRLGRRGLYRAQVGADEALTRRPCSAPMSATRGT